MTTMITPDEEFLNPEINYKVLLSELRQKLERLQKDMQIIEDPTVFGFAEKLYLHYKEKYFSILVYDLDMQHEKAKHDVMNDIVTAISNAHIGDTNE